jgi:hypothetical protein
MIVFDACKLIRERVPDAAQGQRKYHHAIITRISLTLIPHVVVFLPGTCGICTTCTEIQIPYTADKPPGYLLLAGLHLRCSPTNLFQHVGLDLCQCVSSVMWPSKALHGC